MVAREGLDTTSQNNLTKTMIYRNGRPRVSCLCDTSGFLASSYKRWNSLIGRRRAPNEPSGSQYAARSSNLFWRATSEHAIDAMRSRCPDPNRQAAPAGRAARNFGDAR